VEPDGQLRTEPAQQHPERRRKEDDKHHPDELVGRYHQPFAASRRRVTYGQPDDQRRIHRGGSDVDRYVPAGQVAEHRRHRAARRGEQDHRSERDRRRRTEQREQGDTKNLTC
jgi:hypothetical protein